MNRASYTIELLTIVGSIPDANRQGFINTFQASEKNPTLLFGFNVWLGYFGIDRFLVGDVIAGIFKLITMGGFGIWVLIDLFLIGGRARDKNIELARNLRDSFAIPSPASPPPAPAAPATAPESDEDKPAS